MADDIVKRLLASEVYGPADKPSPLHVEAADEIKRLREQVRWASDRASEWKLETYQLTAEIEHLDAALALAVGELSTYGPMRYTSPEQLMQHFLEEARRD